MRAIKLMSSAHLYEEYSAKGEWQVVSKKGQKSGQPEPLPRTISSPSNPSQSAPKLSAKGSSYSGNSFGKEPLPSRDRGNSLNAAHSGEYQPQTSVKVENKKYKATSIDHAELLETGPSGHLNDPLLQAFYDHYESHENNITGLFNFLYTRSPFNSDKVRQNPENVIQFLFIAFEKERVKDDSKHIELFDQLLHTLYSSYQVFENPRHIATIIHRLGKLSEVKRLSLNSQRVNLSQIIFSLLTKLLGLHDSNSQNIANALWGCGKLVESGLGLPENAGEIIIDLLTKLLEQRDSNSQNIANALWGCGKLVEAGLRLPENPGKVIVGLLTKLLEQRDSNSQNIANALWGCGKLVESGLRLPENPGKIIVGLLTKLLEQRDSNSQDIANALWGCGKLVEAGVRLPENPGKIIVDLLTKLLEQRDSNSQNIANALWGCGKLVEGGVQLPENAGEIIIDLLTNLLKQPDSNSQAIANALWGCGKLVEAGLRLPENPGKIIVGLLTKLLEQRDSNSQAIANALWGCGKLVEPGVRLPENTGAILVDLLAKLLEQEDSTSQNIANALWACVHLNYHDESSYIALLRKGADLINSSSSDEDLRQYHQAIGYGYLFIQEEKNKNILKELETQFDAKYTEQLKCNKPSSSELHNTYFKLLQNEISKNAKAREYVQVLENEYYIYGYYADIYVREGEKNHIIEINGPQHYDAKGQLLKQDEIRNRILEGQGYTITIFEFGDDMLESVTDFVNNVICNLPEVSTKQPLKLTSHDLVGVTNFIANTRSPLHTTPQSSAELSSSRLNQITLNPSAQSWRPPS
jgi:very-short-patch-repair endonuclease